ncbi:MAG: hypothetical protein U0103_00015 [Candidatus Obscuribacterales bacterium]
MRIACQTFCLPKAGRSFVDCEDAYFPGDLNGTQLYEVAHEGVDLFRTSVSDGATDSIFSKLWAQLLAFGYGAGKWETNIAADTVIEEQNAWSDFVAKQQLPWYAEEKAELGAFAAFVGLTLYDRSKRWSAMAIGDCCVFQIRNGVCISSFPIASSSAFSNFPLLLCSVPERNGNVFDSKKVALDGSWQSGDLFLLMSDTVACWFLTQMEAGLTHATVESLDSIHSLDAFVSLVSHARSTKGSDGNFLMRDDDVTVTLVRVVDDIAAPLPRKFSVDALSAAVRPTVEMPKPIARVPKETGEMPKTTVEMSKATPETDSQDNKTSAESNPKSVYRREPPGSENLVQEVSPSGGSYATRSRARREANKPNLVIMIGAAFIVAACAISAAVMFSTKETDKQVHLNHKVESAVSDHAPVLPPNKDDTSISKTSGAQRHLKRNSKSTAGKVNDSDGHHRRAPVDELPGEHQGSAGRDNSDQNGSGAIENGSARPAIGSDRQANGSVGRATGGHGQTNSANSSGAPVSNKPINAPQRNIQQSSGRQMPRSAPDRSLPPVAPERGTQVQSSPDQSQMPVTAPDRNSAIPVPLPDHVHQERGGMDRMPSIGSFHHHGRSGSRPSGAVPQPREKTGSEAGKSDMPEDLKN